MKELTATLEPFSDSPFKTNSRELIEKINKFSTSNEFLHWFSNGKYEMHTVLNETTNEYKTLLIQYYTQDLIVLTMRVELNLKKIDAQSAQVISLAWPPSYETIVSLDITKKPVSKIIAEPYYNLVNEISIKDQACGFAWEIFDMARLIEISGDLR